jgi:hypothetical protein
MPQLGAPIVYTPPVSHTYYAQAHVAGQVTCVHDDGTSDAIVFPPGKAPEHVERVPAGEGPGTLRAAWDHDRAQDETG